MTSPAWRGTTIDDVFREAAAQAAHEANRLYCQHLGDNSQVPWEQAPESLKDSCRHGVAGVEKGHTPRESHDNWLQFKTLDGWKYGEVKDADKKEHPCFLPYDQLPPEQKVKDIIFVSVVRGVLTALE